MLKLYILSRRKFWVRVFQINLHWQPTQLGFPCVRVFFLITGSDQAQKVSPCSSFCTTALLKQENMTTETWDGIQPFSPPFCSNHTKDKAFRNLEEGGTTPTVYKEHKFNINVSLLILVYTWKCSCFIFLHTFSLGYNSNHRIILIHF